MQSSPQSLTSAQGWLNNHPRLFCAAQAAHLPWDSMVLFALAVREWHGGYRFQLLPGHQHGCHHVPQHCHSPRTAAGRQQRPQQSLWLPPPPHLTVLT